MKFQTILFVIFLLLIVFICSYIINYVIENFEVVENVDFYVITMRGEDRMRNIEEQKEKLKENNFDTTKFYIIDAVVGKTLDLDQLIKDGKLAENAGLNGDSDLVKRKETQQREVGCYLSHMKALEAIQRKGGDGYSIIFEDDFNLLDDFLKILDETLVKIKNIDFDLLFLGIIGYRGENVLDNIYNIHNGESWGAHGYLVNNRSAGKILDKIKYIDTVLDKEIFDKGKANELIVYRLDPLIVGTVGLSSGIR
jgi:GR25 family glycosyltransferase involved in LPS biosynthesis